MRHIDDEENPADFLTKWVKEAKLKESIEYVTNAANAVEETPKELIDAATTALKRALARVAKEDDQIVEQCADPTAKMMRLDDLT